MKQHREPRTHSKHSPKVCWFVITFTFEQMIDNLVFLRQPLLAVTYPISFHHQPQAVPSSSFNRISINGGDSSSNRVKN